MRRGPTALAWVAALACAGEVEEQGPLHGVAPSTTPSTTAALPTPSSPRDRQPTLTAWRSGAGELTLHLTHPRFYDLDLRRLRGVNGDWDELPEGGRGTNEGFIALLDRYVAGLSRGLLAFCSDAEGIACRPCEGCQLRWSRLEDASGGPPARDVDGHLVRSLVRYDRVDFRPGRGQLCEIRGVREPGDVEVPPFLSVFAPRVRLRLHAEGFEAAASGLPFVKVGFPGWMEPFVAPAYGVEVRDRAGETVCRSIRPAPAAAGPLATHVVARVESDPREAGAVRSPRGGTRHEVAPSRAWGREDVSRAEVMAWSGPSVTFALTSPKVLNIDRRALLPGAPGHGWDLWDPEGWSATRCRRFRSVQCLMVEYGQHLAAGHLSVTDRTGATHVCGEGCSVRLLEVRAAPSAPGPLHRDDVVQGFLRRMARRTGSDCLDLAPDRTGAEGFAEFAAPPLRVVFEARFAWSIPSAPTGLQIRHPGGSVPADWFAGLEVGFPIFAQDGARQGRRRRLCPGLPLSETVVEVGLR